MENSYYAVIPADVRYDEALAPAAKLLYGEITALCNRSGVCWAENGYFAKLYGVSVRTIQLWLSALVDKGYINKRTQYLGEDKMVLRRCLSVTSIEERGTCKNFHVSHEENFVFGMKKSSHIILHMNTTENNTKKLDSHKDHTSTKKLEYSINNNIYIDPLDPPRMRVPTLMEVKEYCVSRGYHIDAGRFMEHYGTNGWMVGKAPMKDWRACVRAWARRESANGAFQEVDKPAWEKYVREE